MAYDSKLIVGQKAPSTNSDCGLRYVSVVATFDLKAMGPESSYYRMVVSKWTNPEPQELYYFYEGDERIDSDCYDAFLLELDLGEAITALSRDDDGYRRIPPVLGMLKAFANTEGQWDDELVLLHYGH